MKQYAQVKAKYPDTILLFRMGDFYETFEDDAVLTSKVLGITLTKRGKNGAAGEIPLAGFPHHALDSYLPKLLKAGYRVAVCEQTEDPKLSRRDAFGTKGIVKRDVVEVLSPGVAFSDKVLENKRNNFLAAIYFPSPLVTGNDMIGVAFIDISTAEFSCSEFPLRNLVEQLQLFSPSEILVQKLNREAIEKLLEVKVKSILTKTDDWIFNYDYAYELLTTQFQTQTLKGFGIENFSNGIIASGAIMHYLNETQKGNLSHLRKVVPLNIDDTIALPYSTIRNLELVTPLSHDSEDTTLLSVLDKTQTPMGGRLLKQWIIRPLKKLETIQQRLKAVDELVNAKGIPSGEKSSRKKLVTILSNIGDVERLISKICTGRATPRDVFVLKTVLDFVRNLKDETKNLKSETLFKLNEQLQSLENVSQLISSAIADEPPLSLVDGNVIRAGFNNELDEHRSLTFSGKEWIANMQTKERERTGINSLKVGFNNVFGYYIEITHTHKDKTPSDYIRKQTMTNAERFITPELKEYEEKILHAEEKILALETKLFNDVRLEISKFAETIQRNAKLIALLDCLISFAEVAVANEYVCPEINDSTMLHIENGRHPVIEQLLPPGERYTANDVVLNNETQQILIITGPNMSGKSSFLRQVGLITLLAHIGSFVPATKATLGLVDKIFTRVGASDNIASGESTFLVEMHEAAHIANTATERSLILLDEVGRGTSTFDGISIAWALTEYLHEKVKAKTLFATHYHELNELAELYPRIKNFKVDVREYSDKVIFLHKVISGFADHSYGIQVAQMAGLPTEVTERAKRILKNLESSELNVHEQAESVERGAKRKIAPEMQMTLFEMKDDKLREELRNIEIEKLTPIDALNKLAELKRKVE
ncbi:MAG: DNA mismatch repair protein MutS [Ignavibacteriales bacterium]|nr:DNA mismatch repair protein MutS [Ignavibacteriales bacterium]